MSASVIKNKPYVFIASSQFIHKIAESLYDLVMPLLVLYITGSPILMGIMYVLGEVAEYLVFLFGGAIADSFNRKKLLITLAIIQVCSIALIPIFEYLGILNIFLLFAIAFMIDLCVCLYGIADISIIPQIVAREDLPKANGLMQSVVSTSAAIGPALSGVIIASLGLFESILVNVMLFGTLLITFRYIKDTVIKESSEKIGGSPKVLIQKSIKGIKYTFKKRLLLLLVSWQSIFIFGIHGSILMMIFYLESELGFSSNQIGLVMTCGAIGGIISGVLFSKLQSIFKKNSGILIGLGSGLVGIAFFILPYGASWLTIGLIYSMILFGVAIVSRLISLYIQYNVNEEYLGRAFAASQLVSSILAPLSIIIAAYLAENYGSSYAFYLSGIVILISSLLTLVLKITKVEWEEEKVISS